MYGDEFYTETWKNYSNVLTNLNCISAKTGQIFYDKASNTSVLNESKGFLKAGSVKVRTCIAVICDNLNVKLSITLDTLTARIMKLSSDSQS